MSSEKMYSIILAAGEGKRMKSSKAKVLHEICGKELIKWVRDAAENADIKESCVVVGHGQDQVRESLKDTVQYAVQTEQKGTGHAVKSAIDFINSHDGHILVLSGDVPLITAESIKKIADKHIKAGNDATIVTAFFEDPKGYGRIDRYKTGEFKAIVEDRDCNHEQSLINEINAGIYCFKKELLVSSLDELECNNAQGEYYLTDVPMIIKNKGYQVDTYSIDDKTEIMGINNRVQLAEANKILAKRIVNEHMNNGVTFIDPEASYLDGDIIIGEDTIVYPNCILEKGTKIGADCIIGPNSRIVGSEIGNNTEVNNSTVLESKVGNNTKVGPYAYMRPNNTVGDNIKVGDFVELKNSNIGDNTKISHLSYVGDSDIGKNVNLGCGIVTVNYNGKLKDRTVVGDNSFVGCNVNLIAPVNVGADAYVAAGSTITEDVPDGALAIARQRQEIKENWYKEKKEKKEL